MLIGDDADYDVDDDDPQVSGSSPNFSMVETDVTTIKLTGLAPNTQVDNLESKHVDTLELLIIDVIMLPLFRTPANYQIYALYMNIYCSVRPLHNGYLVNFVGSSFVL